MDIMYTFTFANLISKNSGTRHLSCISPVTIETDYISYSVNYLTITIAYFPACNFLILIIRLATIYRALVYVPPLH